MQDWQRMAIAILASIAVIAVAIWRIYEAVSGGGSRTTQSISLNSGPNPSCAEPVNHNSPLCSDNPCNPDSSAYTPNDPSCGVVTTPSIRTPTFPTREPSSSAPPSGKPPPAGPVPPSSLSRALDKQLTLYIRVAPSSVSCPPLTRRKGAAVTCHVTGTDLDAHVQVRGTARVTINDQRGQTASAQFSLIGPGGLKTGGGGYPFDPDTGRVL